MLRSVGITGNILILMAIAKLTARIGRRMGVIMRIASNAITTMIPVMELLKMGIVVAGWYPNQDVGSQLFNMHVRNLAVKRPAALVVLALAMGGILQQTGAVEAGGLATTIAGGDCGRVGVGAVARCWSHPNRLWVNALSPKATLIPTPLEAVAPPHVPLIGVEGRALVRVTGHRCMSIIFGSVTDATRCGGINGATGV